MRVDVLALDHVFDLGLSALLDALQTANELIALGGLRVPPFEVATVGVRRRVTSAQGLTVPLRPMGQRRPDTMVVPAIAYKIPSALERALARPDVEDAAAALGRLGRGRTVMAAACIGTFVLAESGVLDGERATTTWWLAPLFRRRYPEVELDDQQMIVRSGRTVTAGAALGHMDLALSIVRSVSPDLAALTAQYLIVDTRPSQSAYALTDHLAHTDPVVRRFERWARARLAEPFSLDAAAAAAGTSKRTLARRLQQVLGRSPLQYVQALRVERAVHLLRTTHRSADEVAVAVGYADGVTLRALLRRRLQTGVRELRRSA